MIATFCSGQCVCFSAMEHNRDAMAGRKMGAKKDKKLDNIRVVPNRFRCQTRNETPKSGHPNQFQQGNELP